MTPKPVDRDYAEEPERYPVCPDCGAVAYGSAFCPTGRANWPDGDPLDPPTQEEALF